MSLLHGQIDEGGPVVDLFVAVSKARAAALIRNGLPVPEPVLVRALIDTGATLTTIPPEVFSRLEIPPVGEIPLYTPSAQPGVPQICDSYHVGLSIVVNGAARRFPDCLVVAAECWHETETVTALLGRDILRHCNFLYRGPDRAFSLGLQH